MEPVVGAIVLYPIHCIVHHQRYSVLFSSLLIRLISSSKVQIVVDGAIDTEGIRIGSTSVIGTIPAANVSAGALTDSLVVDDQSIDDGAMSRSAWTVGAFFVGAIIGIAIGLGLWHAQQKGVHSV